MAEAPLRLRMFAGPNGSGKTSLVQRLAKEYSTKGLFHLHRFVNADDFLVQLRSGAGLDLGAFGLHLSTDQLVVGLRAGGRLTEDHLFFDVADVSNSVVTAAAHACDAYVAAAIADVVREHLLASFSSFAFETVMSHPNKVEFLARGQALGYRTYLYFIATDSPYLNIHRIGNRAEMGGHDVSEDKILQRYDRALALVRSALASAYRAFIFDNSGSEPVWLAETTPQGSIEIKVSDSELPEWFEKYVTPGN